MLRAALRALSALTATLAGSLVLLSAAAVLSLVVAPKVTGWSEVVVLSGSMEPAMPVGGLAFVEPVPVASVEPGDVITFRHPHDPERLVSHRVVAVTGHLGEATIWTKGDANAAPDQWVVRGDDVVGKVRFTLPYLGSISQKLHTRQGIVLVVGIPAIAVILFELTTIVQEVRAARQQQRWT